MLIGGAQLDHPAPPLGDLLRLGLAARPEEVALLSNRRSLTWRQLEEASSRLAAGYRGLGLAPGDRIASLMPNRVDLVVNCLACFKAELIATPLNYRYTATEIDHALSVSGARVLLAHVERAADIEASGLAGGLELGTIAYRDSEPLPQGNEEPAAAEPGWDHDFHRLLEAPPPVRQGGDADPAEPAAIFFTSGSTGPAKGVTHTRETLRWMIAGAAMAFELTDEDVFLPGSSMSHVGSFLWALATLPAALSALINDHDLRRGDFASLRVCRAGADKVSTELLAEFAAATGFPIVEGYGMTEVGLATLNPPSGEIRQGSIGIPIGGYRIELRGEEGEPIEAKRSAASGSTRAAGWSAPDATAEVVVDGRLDSGDLARADADLVDHPAVAPAAAVGVHDTVHGENVRAYVTLAEGAERPSAADLIVHCRERIGYKAPEEIVFLDEMPLNPTGKIDRVGLKRMAEEHLHPHGLP
jgi:acyl-coenzyme A synthetase/AMP-(fatty) acid ligase